MLFRRNRCKNGISEYATSLWIKHVDARADVYSLGVVAYRVLTGKSLVGRFADPVVAAKQFRMLDYRMLLLIGIVNYGAEPA